MIDHSDLIKQNEEKYITLAEGIIGVLKSYGGHMTAREIARELFTDSTLVMMALNDAELGLPIIKVPLGNNGSTLVYKFLAP